MSRLLTATALVTALSATTPIADAATNSTAASVTLSAILSPSISVTVSPTTASFSNLNVLGAGSVANTLVVTTTWALAASTTLSVYGYFLTATAAMTDGNSHNIPSSAISGTVDSGTATPFTGTSPFGSGSSITIYSVPITALNLAGLHADNLVLGISLAGITNLPPATYNGTLYIEAQAL